MKTYKGFTRKIKEKTFRNEATYRRWESDI